MTIQNYNNSSLCRDCGADVAQNAEQCPICRSYRLLQHPELHHLSIAHIDCDAFFAAVEKRDDPSLADKPVIIGGGTRGVVAAACYNARVYGVHSAMPMFKALKACPHAVVIRGNHDKYSQEGARIKAIMREYTPLVQSLSIDEAFVDLTGTERLHDSPPALTLIKIQNRITTEIGITVSVGLSYNKFLAKTASDLDKPNGFAVLGKVDALNFLTDKPVGFIFGVGPAFTKVLNQSGIFKISDVRKHSDTEMMQKFGEAGLRLAKLARAEDHRPVKVGGARKSISTEITFNTDIGGANALTDRLWQVCEKTAHRAKAKNMAGYVVTLKLKTNQFKSITRRRTLADPVQLADIIFQTTLPLLQAEISPTKKYRLIGVGISTLCAPIGDAADLLDPKAQKRRIAERASDKAREKFGTDAVMTGRTLRRKMKSKPKKTDD